jgi:hypothetical protein
MVNVSDIRPYGDFPELQDFQYDGYNYNYDLPPQQNNLFMLDKFYDPYNADVTADGYDSTSLSPKNIQYRIKKISGFSLPKLNIDSKTLEGPFRWNYVSSGRTDANQLTIEWMEDAFWSVKRYHMNWMNHWYNRYLDCMVVGQEGKFRNLVFYLFRYKNLNTETAIPIQKAVPVARFEFKGLIPESLPETDFGWGDEVNTTASIRYRYNYLEIYFYPFTKDEKEFIGGLADIIQRSDENEKTGPKDVWNTGILGFTKTLQNMNDVDGQFSQCKDGLHYSVYYI